MSSMRKNVARQRVGLAIRARKLARENTTVLIVLAVIVAVGVTALLTRRVLAAKHQVRVLDCHVAGAVAHHHDDSCYDDEGNLVCSLPERDVHVHDQSCYERRLVCGQDEGAGAHYHDESCYDEWGGLVCGQDESAGHQHDDSCYADVLACNQEECSEEHVHGDGCWKLVAANEDAEEYTHPKQSFHGKLRQTDDSPELTVDVEAPLGTLPNGASLEVRRLEGDDARLDLVQAAVDKHAEEQEGAVPGRVMKYQAVGLTFRDREGEEIQPASEVTIKLTTPLAQTQGPVLVAHVENEAEARARVEQQAKESEEHKQPTDETKPEVKPEAQFVETFNEDQLSDRKLKLEEDQLAFEAVACSEIVVATTSLQHQMVSTDGATTTITVDASPEAGIPQDAYLDVTKVAAGTPEYDEFLARTTESMSADRSDVAMAAFFDIHIKDEEGREFQPQAPVDVKIELSEIPDAPNGFAAVHFRNAGEEGQTELDQLECGGENGTVTFAADSFSVYGIVYTVDFGYEVDGQLYQCTLPGGGSIGLRELVEALHIHEGDPRAYEDVPSFMADVQSVVFSDPSLVWVEPVIGIGRKSTGELLETLGLDPTYTSETSAEQIAEWKTKEYEDDWVLLSLKPFTSIEMLTVTMVDGTQRLVQVTDTAADGIAMKTIEIGGQQVEVVDTLPNPPGTTIDLFDYWVGDESYRWIGRPESGSDRDGRPMWPSYKNPSQTPAYENQPDGPKVNGYGNNSGINQNHNLKFDPADGSTVLDGPRDDNGNLQSGIGSNTKNMNQWTTSANPKQGIVADKLGADGFPVSSNNKNLGTTDESLAYLFDAREDAAYDTTGNPQPGKQRYDGVNNLLYVDPDGYYVFDSWYYWADFDRDPNSETYKTFTLTEQRYGTNESEKRGFWPFGREVYWTGMHMKSEFSMPEDGIVLNPQGEQKPMTFEFMGDDDTWLYIDGVLVGDGGGIHNRTYIKIDYSTGEVTVSGKEDWGQYQGNWSETITLREIFENAGVSAEYMAENFDEGSNTFKSGSYHTFDMFYLERGGGESNLKIKYNLVSTGDFTSHKDYIGPNGDSTLERNDYKFDLIGLNGRYNNNGVDTSKPAIKPKTNGKPTTNNEAAPNAGTIELPYTTDGLTMQLGNDTYDAWIYRVGVTEDGNVNFGLANIPNQDETDCVAGNSPTYRYIVREHIPDEAVNVNGKMYKWCTEEEKKAGPFMYGDAVYDPDVYYMEATVTRWTNHDIHGNEVHTFGLSKRYYSDEGFSQPRTDPFINFENRHVDPVTLNVSKVDVTDQTTDPQPLSGATFVLSHASQNESTGKWAPTQGQHVEAPRTKTSDGNGRLSFDSLPAGYYILEETDPPAGYKLPSKKWLVELRKEDITEYDPNDPSVVTVQYSKLVPHVTELSVDGAATGSPQQKPVDNLSFGMTVENEEIPDFSFDVVKQWEGIEPNSSDLANTSVTVTIGRYKLAKRAGTLTITKSGVPAGAHVKAKYEVFDANADPSSGPVYTYYKDYTSQPSPWNGQGVTISDSFAPGTYYVVETIESDDNRYGSIQHNGETPSAYPLTRRSPDIVLEDEGEGSAEFTSTYGDPKTGSLKITSTLNNRTDTEDSVLTQGVNYTITDEDGNSQTVSYADLNDDGDGKSKTLSGLIIGNYSVVENGWPTDLPGFFTHDPENCSVAAQVVEGSEPVVADFQTTYMTSVTVNIYTYDINWDNGTIGNDVVRRWGPETVESPYVQFSFTSQPQCDRNWSNPNDKRLRIGTSKGDASFNSEITWERPNDDNNNQTGTVRVPIAAADDNGVLNIYVGRPWNHNDITDVQGYPPASGYLNIKAMPVVDNRSQQGQSIVTNDVRYIVKDTSGNQVGPEITYAQASGADGYTIPDPLTTGNYTVETYGWPNPGGAQYAHSPASGSSVTVHANTTTQYVSTTTYSDPPDTVKVKVVGYQINNSNNRNDVWSGEIAGNTVTIVMRTQTNNNEPAATIVGNTYGNDSYHNNLTWSRVNGDYGNYYFEGRVDIPVSQLTVIENDYHMIYIGTNNGYGSQIGSTSVGPQAQSGGNGNPTSMIPATSLTRRLAQSAATNLLLLADDLGDSRDSGSDDEDQEVFPEGLPPAPAGMKYVLDPTFMDPNDDTQPYTVTLTLDKISGSVWKDTVSGIDGFDENHRPYYYFIQDVVETGLPDPDHTTLSQVVDTVYQSAQNGYQKSGDLTLNNVVGVPGEIHLFKAEKDANGLPNEAKLLDGAVFQIAQYQNDHHDKYLNPGAPGAHGADYIVSPLVSTETVTIDASSYSFTVPHGGVVISGLKNTHGHQFYKLIEMGPPDGYILDESKEYDFEITGDIIVAHGESNPLFIKNEGTVLMIPNAPGEELPHSGGVGSIAISVAGLGLIAAGVLVLTSKRRKVRAEVGQHVRKD